MDPLSAAGAFASLVGLISIFKSERSSSDLPDFIDWLKEKHHEELANSIQRNDSLSQQLNQIISSNHSELIEKLNQFDILISSMASQIQDFSELAKIIHTESIFSDQAISILKQFVTSGAKIIMERKMNSSKLDQYRFLDGGYGQIEYDEPRFIEDDFNTLIKTGLLRPNTTPQGYRQFMITRTAIAFIEQINVA